MIWREVPMPAEVSGARDSRSVLILPGSNIDLPTWRWVGHVVTNIADHERRWKEPLLDRASPLAVLFSLPRDTLDRMAEKERLQVRQAWEDEKRVLEALLAQMRERFTLDISQPIDLTDDDPDRACAVLWDAFSKYPQILGIAHVPGVRATSGKACRIRTRFFELGQGARLDSQFLEQLRGELRDHGGHPRRALFLGCETMGTVLPKAFTAANLSIHFLATSRPVSMAEMLVFTRAVLIQGYAQKPAAAVRDDVWSTYVKLVGYMLAARRGPSTVATQPVLVLEGADLGSESAGYYVAGPCTGHGIPHLEITARAGAVERVRELVDATGDSRLLVVDVPVNLRTELRAALGAAPALWVATGSTCESVSTALFEDGVEYHVGYVQTSSTHLAHRFLQDSFVCVSRYDEPLQSTVVLPSGGTSGADLRRFLFEQVGGIRKGLVVVGARP
jgi:hypothetical protein